MTFPIRKYNLDKTGSNPENYVQGEKQTLKATRGTHHAVAPFYGPFYYDKNSFKVYRNGSELTRDVDYFGIALVADEGTDFGGEVCELLMVKGSSENDVIMLDYQVLGGLYQNYAKGLEDLWNAFINDDRPVDWVNVIGKKTSWNPSYHLHMLKDIVGWQPVIIALERLSNAITLRNVPAFEALIDWVLKRIPDIVGYDEIGAMNPVDKLVNFNRLLYAARALNFNAITWRPGKQLVKPGDLVRVDMSSTNFPREQLLYWTILHGTTVPEMFRVNSGVFLAEDNEASIFIPTSTDYKGLDEVGFRVELRRGSREGAVLAETRSITLQFNPVWSWDYGLLANGLWEFPIQSSLLYNTTPESAFLIPSLETLKDIAAT